MAEEKPPTPPEVKPQVTPQSAQQATPKVEINQPVVYVKPNKKQKMEIYGQLLNVTDIDALDRKVFAETRKIPSSTLGGMISQMKNQPNVYRELRRGGFTDAQIPGWVARPAQSVGSVSQLPGSVLKPAAALPIVELGQENATERPTDQPSNRPTEQANQVYSLVNQLYSLKGP